MISLDGYDSFGSQESLAPSAPKTRPVGCLNASAYDKLRSQHLGDNTKSIMGANRDQFALIENISAISGEAAADLRETLDKIVAAIAERMEAEVCSLYLFDPQRERLVLRATLVPDRDSVGKVSMRTNEGRVGTVIEKGDAV